MSHVALRFLSKTTEIMATMGLRAVSRTSGAGLMTAVSDVLGVAQAGLDYQATKVRKAATQEEVALLEKQLILKRDALKKEVELAKRESGDLVPLESAQRVIQLATELVQDVSAWLNLLLEEDIPDREQLENVQEMLEDAWEQLSKSLTGWKDIKGGVSNG